MHLNGDRRIRTFVSKNSINALAGHRIQPLCHISLKISTLTDFNKGPGLVDPTLASCSVLKTDYIKRLKSEYHLPALNFHS